MSDNTSRSLTSEVEVEQLLRDSAMCDLFGSPPRNLLVQSMAAIAIDEPCEERGPTVLARRPALLMVLSLVAAGLFIAALPGLDGRHRTYAAANMTRRNAERPPIDNQAVVLTEEALSASSQPVDDQATNSSSIEQVSTAPFRRRRNEAAALNQSAPKAIWTTTVVSESEQGVVLPVVTSNVEPDRDGMYQTGVAIVPLQSSGLMTAEYTGPGQ